MTKVPGMLVTVVCQLIALSAFATNNRSAVASSGLDTNPCTVSSPCRSFSAAMAVTADGGEIIALDSAGYGPFSISQNVSVSGAPGVHAAITATSLNAITVNGSLDSHVNLRNLQILGGGTGAAGIANIGVGRVLVSGCFIQGFGNYGIRGTSGTMAVDHTLIADCSTGIAIQNSLASIDHSEVFGCAVAVNVVSFGQAMATGSLRDVTTRWNNFGVLVSATNGSAAAVTLDHCAFTDDQDAGVSVSQGTGATLVLTMSYNWIDVLTAIGTYTINSSSTNTIGNGASGVTLTPFTLK